MDGKSLYDVRAPLSGTFYRAPSPEDSPYVKVGQVVEAGDVLCIVESMKVFSEIRTQRRGKVKNILFEDEDPVNKGQVLIRIELK